MPSRSTQIVGVLLPRLAEYHDVARVPREQPFADLDGRGLAGAVRAEEAEAFAVANFEVEAVYGDDIAIGFPEAAYDQSVCRCHHRGTKGVMWVGQGCRRRALKPKLNRWRSTI